MNTQRENEILNLLIQGKTNKEIADLLAISIHTVKTHIEHLYLKNNVNSRVQLAVKAVLTDELIK